MNEYSNEYDTEKRFQLLEAKTELQLKISENSSKRKIFLMVALAIIGVIVSLYNIFAGCPCGSKISPCWRMVFNIMNAIFVVLSFSSELCEIFYAHTLKGRRRKQNVSDDDKNTENKSIDEKILQCKNVLISEQEKAKFFNRFYLFLFGFILFFELVIIILSLCVKL